MTCRVWQNLLQQQLDGGLAGPLEQHAQACPHCAAEQPAVRRLLDGIALLTPPVPPDDLSDRITHQLFAAIRRRRQRRRIVSFVGVAAAAAVLIALGVRAWQPLSTIPQPDEYPLVKAAEPGVEPTRTLHDSMIDASSAVASLTSRTAGATMDQTAALLPMLPAPTMEPLSVMQPPMAPLREASAGVSAGLAPVADSARRAVGLFLRDLPMGRSDHPAVPNKPG